MIKLNNKNITYVALADSNNSLKAPKEIWYADSSNSVKLVYRRKDALIEGEDYEKYHWLNGDGSAYINTTHNTNEDLDWETKVDNIRDNTFLFWFRTIQGMGDESMIVRTTPSRFRYANNSYEFEYNLTSQPINVETFGTTIFINGTGHSITKYYHRPSILFRLFYAEVDAASQATVDTDYTTNNVKCAYFRFIDANGTTILNLIPCKLLKPVPKWLDANGISRQVGECGMIDLVSGKFYGNVNSVGTFTVENYYERKEWLVGDGSAYIVNKYNLWNNNVETRSAKINLQEIHNNDLVYTDANGLNWAIQQNPTLVPQLMVNFREEGVNVHILEVNHTPETFELKFYKKNGYAVCLFDGIEHQGRAMTESKWNKDISPRIYSYKMSYIREVLPDGSYRSNLIPCTLTMDLPASMDANNIARTKGTSGMWDLVSDKFYGNVANSGTFKAVNLAEGVDYEVHQWLVGDGSAYINTLITKFDGIVDISFYFSSYNSRIFGREKKDSSIEDYSERFVVTINNNVTPISRIYGNDTNGAELPIANDERLIIDIDNGVATNKNGDTAIISVMANVTGRNLYLFADNYMNNPYKDKFNGRIGLFSISNKIYLIPVKLLKSIPSKYDANGIARQAGECGMYDTVNDVFYGNVAASGSFTVSDN